MPSAAHSFDQFIRFVVLRYMPALLAIAILVLFGAAANIPPSDRWEPVIKKFEEADKLHPPPQNATVFVGSSSIAFWDIQKSFPGLEAINRGFGGSLFRDAAYYADRIVIPYKPRTVVIYEGDNDIDLGISAEDVFRDFKSLEAKIRDALPDTRIIVLSIKPSVKRWNEYEAQQAANKLIEDYTKSHNRLLFVNVGAPLLGTDGKPRPELFKPDGLHLNDDGYRAWIKILSPIVMERKS